MLLKQRISFYLEDIETIPGRTISLIITGLVLLSSAIPIFLGLVDITFILIFRWFTILRLILFIEGREDTVIFAKILIYLFAVFVFIIFCSGLIYYFEHSGKKDELFSTFLDAVYFSVVTMTTVGFGDVTPHSKVGRLMTVLMSLTGIGLVAFIPWEIGKLIKKFDKTTNQIEMLYPRCGSSLDDAEAQFCKLCGTKLEKV